MLPEEEQQKELFELEKPKRRFLKLGNVFPRRDLPVTLSTEKLVFIAIGLVMLMVLIYALGVERGKSLGPAAAMVAAGTNLPDKPAFKPPAQESTQIVSGTQTRPPVPVKETASHPMSKKAIPLPQVKTVPVQPKEEATAAGKYIYTIVTGAFSRRESAAAQVKGLKKEGFDAFVAESDSYFLACAGAFPNTDSAQSKKMLSRIRQTYKDAYFKLK